MVCSVARRVTLESLVVVQSAQNPLRRRHRPEIVGGNDDPNGQAVLGPLHAAAISHYLREGTSNDVQSILDVDGFAWKTATWLL
jgi:hypothetical protein